MKIRKKLVLVFAVAITQALCLAWGVFIFGSWLEGSIRDTVHRQVLAENVETAKQMARLIRAMDVDDPRRDVASWRRLQEVVQDIRLPNEGFVCLTDASTGKVLCHPELRGRPAFSAALPEQATNERVAMAKKPAMGRGTEAKPSRTHGAGKEKADPAGGRGRVSAGVVDTADGLQIIAAAQLPEIEAQVLVHQLGRGIDAAIARVTAPIRPIGIAVALGLVALTTLAVAGVVQRYENRLATINANLEKLVERRTKSLMKTRNGLIFGLAKLAESRDTDTGEHLDRIRRYVTILAEQLMKDGLAIDQDYVDNLALASSLHDIGKVGVPDSVLLKPGRLDADEREVIETHAEIGGDCLQALGERLGEDDFLQLAKEIAYGHHERWDGDGYPFKVAGELIPLSARIVAVADVYDALRSKRPYKDGMPHEQARAILLEGSGAHFDPLVVEAFLASEHHFTEVADLYDETAASGAVEVATALT
ncbi:MAG: HD domain-containing phosphohydrolase [Planctomycetota bacterium]